MTQMQRWLPFLCTALVLAGCSTQTASDTPTPDPDDDEQSGVNESPPETSKSDDGDEETVEPAPYDKPPPHDREYDISEVYAQMCASCHGDRGDGDGSVEDGFAFDTPADKWSNGPTIHGILDTLEDGIHDTAMREFPEFKDVDRVELAEYVVDLRHALDPNDADDENDGGEDGE